ncbi:MAG TPA: hypothetical protein VN229_23540 [Terriglobales bacterium]|nr:hypothetical protein [Terriglobales bacterium]
MFSEDALSTFELPEFMVKPALEACRMYNCSLDALFYDVQTLERALRSHDTTIVTPVAEEGSLPLRQLDLGALKNPEGALLVVDTQRAPYIRSFDNVTAFLGNAEATITAADVVTITGVGSSALGSAALAWNVAMALKRPVLAIVPGYGVADVILQGLGGWFGFGLHDFLKSKSNIQTFLGMVAPRVAAIGRGLSASVPDSKRLSNGAPVFRTGCGSSDVLHALMQARAFKCVVGHSKGALSISNALNALPPESLTGLKIVTFGCPIAEAVEGTDYRQFLGLFDGLGALNAWGNRPESWLATDHSTNVSLPLSMDVTRLID